MIPKSTVFFQKLTVSLGLQSTTFCALKLTERTEYSMTHMFIVYLDTDRNPFLVLYSPVLPKGQEIRWLGTQKPRAP